MIRRTALSAALVTSIAALSPVPLGQATGTAEEDRTRWAAGRVLVVAGENGEPDTYSLRLRSGRELPLANDTDAEPLSWFRGRLRFPDARASGDAGYEMDRAEVTAPAPAPHVTAHSTYIAKVTNFGSFSQADDALRQTVEASHRYWVQQSEGRISSWNVADFRSVTSDVGSAASGCGLDASEFASAVAHVGERAYPGVDFSGASPNHLLVIVPPYCHDQVLGRARVGVSLASGGPAIIDSGPDMKFTLDHEYGHNLGLHHSSNAVAEYGGAYEVMGSGPAGFASPVLGTVYRHEQGVIAPDEVADGTSGGSWTLAPRSASSGLRSVSFIDPDTGLHTFVDYRDGSGADGGALYSSGLGVITSFGQSYRPGLVIEREKGESGSFLHADADNNGSLQPGEVWSNAGGSVAVRATAANALTITTTPKPGLTGGSVSLGGTIRATWQARADVSGFSPAPTMVRYQWLLNGQPIPEATDDTLPLTPGMAGSALSVRATAYAVGRAPTSVESAGAVVEGAEWYAKGPLRYPTISGTPLMDQVLTASGLDWVDGFGGKPVGFSTRFEWLRDGAPIPGAVGPAYRISPPDVGTWIQVREVPVAPGFNTTSSARSVGVGPVAAGSLAKKRPRIVGKPRVGKSLKVRTKGWSPGTRFSYKWYANGKAIKKAKKKKLKLTRSLRRKRIQVKVTGRKPGYKTARSKSKAVRVR